MKRLFDFKNAHKQLFKNNMEHEKMTDEEKHTLILKTTNVSTKNSN